MKLANVELAGNEHGRFRANVLYVKLVHDDGGLIISATLEYVLAVIRDRKLDVDGVTVSYDDKGNSTVTLDRY